MRTYVIIDGYSSNDRRRWENVKPTTNKIRIVLVHSYIEEFTTTEDAISNYLSEARLGVDYLIRD